jgi:hypothetical protein
MPDNFMQPNKEFVIKHNIKAPAFTSQLMSNNLKKTIQLFASKIQPKHLTTSPIQQNHRYVSVQERNSIISEKSECDT